MTVQAHADVLSHESSGWHSAGSFTIEATTKELIVSAPTNGGRVTEAGGASTFTVRLGQAPSGDVTVGVSSLDSTEGSVSPSSLTFTSTTYGTAQTVTVTGVQDTAYDGTQAWKVRLDPASSADSTYNGLADVDVAMSTTNDDPSVSIDSPSVVEGDSGTTDLTFTVTLSPASDQPVTMRYRRSGGTAFQGYDIEFFASGHPRNHFGGGSLTFAAGETSKTLTVVVIGNTRHDGDRSFRLDLDRLTGNAGFSEGSGRSIFVPGGITTIGWIRDDDVPSLSIDSPSVAEGDSGSTDLTFTVTLSPAYTRRVTVDYTDAGTGTATSGTDYTAVTAGTLAFAAGVTSRTITVAVTGDTMFEADETVVVTLSGVSVVGLLPEGQVPPTITIASGTGTITDDDTPNFSVDSPSVAEGDSGSTDLTFTVSLSPASSLPVTVDYSDAGTGTATSGTDYTGITAGTLTFAAGVTSRTITVAVTGDTTDEADETVVVVVTLSGASAGSRIATANGAGTITDDDVAPTLSIDSPSVAEGTGATGGTLTFTVSLSAASGKQVTVGYADAGTGTATSGTDYTAVTAGTLTFAASETSRTFTVSVTGDAEDEPNETIVVTLGSPTNAMFSEGASSLAGTGTITDDDGPSFSIDSPSVAEGDGGSTNLTFTVSLSPASFQAVTVDYADAETGTATSGTDYTAVTAGMLTFAAGETSRTITVAVTGDTTDETDETVVVTLSGASAGSRIATASGAGTITNDDGPGFSIDSPSVTEGDSGSTNLTFTVTLNPASPQPVTVDYGDAGTGTAISGTDYTAVTAGTLTFAAGVTSRTITVAVTGDTTDETDETVVVTLSGASAGSRIETASGAGTITDDDGPSLSIDSPSVTEGDSGSTNLTFTVTLSAASPQPVTVDYADAGTGTATSGTDYTAVTAGTLTLAASETSRTFTVSVTGDTGNEPDETVVVTLGNPTNAMFSGGVSSLDGTGTITTDDGSSLSIDSPSVAEGDSGSTNLTFTVSLSPASPWPVTVDYADAGTGTATSGTDYTAVIAGTLTFAANETSRTFTVSVTGDAEDEPNETVIVNLTTPANAILSGRASSLAGTGTITDDDVAPTLSIDSPSVAEGDSGSTNLTFTVSLSVASGKQVRVVLQPLPSSSTATLNTDYTARLGVLVLTFAAGETSKTFPVSVTGDTTIEADETVVVELRQPTNAVFSGGATFIRGTGTIVDDDATADVNQDGLVDEDDVLVMYYAYTAPGLLNRSRLRRLVLRPLLGRGSSSSKLEDTDSDYMTMLSNANDWQNNPSASGDVNQDGLVDEDDVLVMYYAYTAPGLLNRSRLRRLVLRPLLGRGSSSTKLEDTDDGYMTMLSNANALSTSP